MTIYYELINGKINTYNNQSCRSHWQNCNTTDEQVVMDDNGQLRLESDWEEEKLTEEYIAKKTEEEAEQISMLHLTRGDVFRALLKAKGVTRVQLRNEIENNENLAADERELALIDFDEALEFYRGISLVSILGTSLGITSTQLDEFFETNDYTKLLPTTEQLSV